MSSFCSSQSKALAHLIYNRVCVCVCVCVVCARVRVSTCRSDCYEWWYHRLGHTTGVGWKIHKHHHAFHNPSPFAVIADEPPDQFVRALPLLFMPLLLPTNMDMLFVTYSVVFYFYGCYLHCGHELPYPDAHHTILNTSFQHCIHHAVSIRNRTYHTGFFFKVWDNMVGAVHPKSVTPGPDCPCAKCSRHRGKKP